MRSLVVAVLAVAACGDVNKIPDAGPPDMFTSDGPPTCGTGEMLCNNTCANPLTSEDYCGNCATRCNTLQACESGACVPADSCTRVREANPNAGDGLYSGPNSVTFYCDFTDSAEYDQLAMGLYTSTFAGYTLVEIADLQNVAFQKAFIALYNLQGSMPTLATWTSTNCCFTTTGSNDVLFGASILYPAVGSTSQCNQAGGYTSGAYTLYKGTPNTALPPPLASDFFTTNPVTTSTQCSDGNGPGFFVKKRTVQLM